MLYQDTLVTPHPPSPRSRPAWNQISYQFIIPPGPANEHHIAMFDLWRPDQLQNSGYIWLPIRWEREKMVIQWQAEWAGD